jgi:hypothetical protein
MTDLQKIVANLSKLSVLEAAELSKMLKDTWSGAGAGAGSRPARLFEDRERILMEPLRRGKTLFEFYDDCARPGYGQFRSIVNSWLAEMPETERGELSSIIWRCRVARRSKASGIGAASTMSIQSNGANGSTRARANWS